MNRREGKGAEYQVGDRKIDSREAPCVKCDNMNCK